MLEPGSLVSPAVRVGIVAAGTFFLSGLLTGVWKYVAIARSPQATAPVYVDIAHRASLLYAFAALLLAQFAALSIWSEPVNLYALSAPVVFFAAAIVSYVIHGILRDTDNQFRSPHRLGRWRLPRGTLPAFMGLLIAAEVGGFAVLFAGVLARFC
jgi:hypothetical protein